MGYKTTIFNFTCGALLFLLFLVGTNYGVDMDHSFRVDREKQVAQWLAQKKHVANFRKSDERLINKLLIEEGKQANCVVLGSSRGLQINQSMFRHTSFHNYAHEGATIQDFLAYTRLLEKREMLPQKVILVLDPWMLNVQKKQFLGPLSESYWLFAHRLDLKPNRIHFRQNAPKRPPYSKLLNLNYLSKNINGLINQEYPWMYTSAQSDLPDPVKQADGSLSYPASVRQASIKEIFAKAERMAYGPAISVLKNFKKLDEAQLTHLKALQAYYESKNVEVLIYLPPFNPIVWGTIQNDPSYKAVLETESYLKEFAEKRGLMLMGSYNPHNMYLNPEDFYDGMHLSRQATERFFLNGVTPKKAKLILS